MHLRQNLTRASTYYWRVRAASRAGSSDEVVSEWSATATFSTFAVRLGAPQPVSPIGGVTVGTRRPRFNVRNGTVEGDAGTVIIQIQVATDSGFGGMVADESTQMGAGGDTNVHLRQDLRPGRRYHWRARARNDRVVGPWSATEHFLTPSANAPGQGDCCPPPRRFDIVQAVVAETGNLYRDDVTRFTQRVAECLAVIDGDWGRRLNDSGAIGKDTVAYRVPGSSNPYSIDIVLGATGPDPRPHWDPHGQVGGTWFAVDGSDCILDSVADR